MPRTGAPYYSLPSGIVHRHIRRAAAEIDRVGVPPQNRSRSFDALVGGKQYPAKHVVRLAAKHATRTKILRFHAHQAVKLLEKLGYKVINLRTNGETEIASEDGESASPEGTERFRMHRRRERDGQIVRKAKALRLKRTGNLECEVCTQDFAKTYGDIGLGFIEAHHTIPIAKLDGKARTRIRDLAMVCSNCHRMLHRSGYSLQQLRKVVQAHSQHWLPIVSGMAV